MAELLYQEDTGWGWLVSGDPSATDELVDVGPVIEALQALVDELGEGSLAPAVTPWLDELAEHDLVTRAEIHTRIHEFERDVAALGAAIWAGIGLLETEPGTNTPPKSENLDLAYVDEITRIVHNQMVRRSIEYVRAGRSLEDLGNPESVAGRMMNSLPHASPWDDALGPFYVSSQVQELLGGISRQALAERRKRRSLLALRTDDDRWVYPVAQFRPDGRILDGLVEAIRLFDPEQVDEWTVAGWLASPSQVLEGASPLAWLSDRRPLERVLQLAEGAAARFAA